MAFMHQEQSLEIQEQYIAFLVQNVIDHCTGALKTLDRDVDTLKRYTQLPYPRISYDEAIELLKENDFDVDWGVDFGSPEETFLADRSPVASP